MKKYQDIEKTSRDWVRLSERPVTSIGTAVVACPGAVPGRPGPGPDVGSGCVSSLASRSSRMRHATSAAGCSVTRPPRQSPWRGDFQVDGGVARPYFSYRRDPHMKSLAVVSVVLVCAIGCGLMTASAAPSSSDVGVFVRADTSCPPANFAL